MGWLWTPETPGDVPPGVALAFAAAFTLLLLWLMWRMPEFRRLGLAMLFALAFVTSMGFWAPREPLLTLLGAW